MKKRRKAAQNERAHREGHVVRARPVKTIRKSAALQTVPLNCE
jgi:hypothetical protein